MMRSGSELFSVRFVVLHHTGIDDPHFDLMFETTTGSPLTTWRSPAWPIVLPVGLTRLPDHRAAYLEFEGALSGNRGEVRRIATGACAIDRTDHEAFWTIRFADPTAPLLQIKLVDRDHWLAVPSCGG